LLGLRRRFKIAEGKMTRLNVSLDMGGSIVCNCSVAGREFWRWLPVAAATHPCNSFSRPTVTPRDDSHRHVGFTAATRFSSPRFTAATRFTAARRETILIATIYGRDTIYGRETRDDSHRHDLRPRHDFHRHGRWRASSRLSWMLSCSCSRLPLRLSLLRPRHRQHRP